jgi:hypothetical protein
MYVNPNNIKKDRCKSEAVSLSSWYFEGGLIEGSPLATPGSKTVTVSGGGGISIGYEGKTPEGSITGTFNISKTKTIYDLDIAGYREVINSGDKFNRKFRVVYNYVDGLQNDITYFKSTSALRYLVIYEKNTTTNIYQINMSLYGKFVYDAPWPSPNINITDRYNFLISINKNNRVVSIVT